MTRFVGAILFAAICVGSASADNLSRCATIANDSRRLACYDDLAGRVVPARPSTQADRSDLQAIIIERCESRFGGMGPAAVKRCVDRDLPAARVLRRMLQGELSSLQIEVVERCASRFGGMGPAAVKRCVDRDLPAARELERMKRR